MKEVLCLTFLVMMGAPLAAQQKAVDKPVENFDKLWATFDKRYANFALKGVDWDSVYTKYRSQVKANTTNYELLLVSCAMVQELNDGHVYIEPRFKERDIECGPPYTFQLYDEFNTQAAWDSLEQVIDETLTQNGFSSAMGKAITEDTNFEYRLAKKWGYIRLDEMTEALTFGRFASNLNTAMKAMNGKAGLIIDLRFNGGGWDRIAYRLASCLLAEGTSVEHYERKRIKGTMNYTPQKHRRVKRIGSHAFSGPIVILTSDFTASAAEVFLLLVKDLPYVTLIGDTTEGIFSDMYSFRLPNKWVVTLSDQQYFDTQQNNFEGIGIAPAIQALNTREDLSRGEDSVLALALKTLEELNQN